jgi:hypothetical protein
VRTGTRRGTGRFDPAALAAAAAASAAAAAVIAQIMRSWYPEQGPARQTTITTRVRSGAWLTGAVPDVVTLPAETIPVIDEDLETGEPAVAHIVKTEPEESAAAKVLEARIYGSPVEALCGHVWVPSRDPKQLPLCQKCKEIYEVYRAFNEGLNDRPDDA